MGQARHRQRQLGDLYGTPEGTNRRDLLWPGLDPFGKWIITAQRTADDEGQALATWVVGTAENGWPMVRLLPVPPADEPDDLIWVPTTKPDTRLTYRHPIWLQRSALSGHWAVNVLLSGGLRCLDVFADLATGLLSAQNSQAALGDFDATCDRDQGRWTAAVHACSAADDAMGIVSDDGVIATFRPGANGFRTVHGTGKIPADRMPLIVDSMRQAGIHVRMSPEA